MDWTDEPYSDPRRSPRACLNRQAGFTAARPAANWIPSSAAAWRMPADNPAVSGRLCVGRRVGEDIRRDADYGLEDWSGCFRPYVARKIEPATRGSVPEEDRVAQALKHWPWTPVSDVVRNPRLPAPAPKAQRLKPSGVRPTASIGHDVVSSRETNRPRRKDRRNRADCNRRHHWRRHSFLHGGPGRSPRRSCVAKCEGNRAIRRSRPRRFNRSHEAGLKDRE